MLKSQSSAPLITDANGNSGFAGPNGRIPVAEISAPGADVLASKQFPYLFNLTRKALNTSASPTFTTTPTPATEVFVDFNRGSDANDGSTRFKAKKNISALSTQAYGPGSVIALASDSTWELLGTLFATSAVNASNWVGSAGNPLLVTAYDAAGHTGLKPTLTQCWRPAASEWTWDAAMNAWLWQPTTTVFPTAGTCVFFGASRIAGIDAHQDYDSKTTVPALFGDRQFTHKQDYTTVRKLWVWAPSNVNPTDYYGGVMFSFPARGPFVTTTTGLSNTIIDGLKFMDTASGITINPAANSGANVITGLVVKNCETYRAGLLHFSSNETAAHDIVVKNNKGVELPAYLVKLSGGGSSTLKYDIHSNDVQGCNRQTSNMAAFYVQTVSPNLGDSKLHHNYVKDAWNGVGTELGAGFGSPYDGAAYYFDIGSSKSIAYANIAERCHVAFQTNSARTVQLIANMALDCNVLSTSTDAISVGSNDVMVAHNTYINRLPDVNQLKRGTSSSPNFGISNWFENPVSSTIRVFNNALYRAAPVAGYEAIRVAGEAAATKYVAGNAISGWSGGSTLANAGVAGAYAVARSLDGTAVLDITSSAIVVNGGGGNWFESGTVVPAANSPLTKAGVRYIDSLIDAAGVSYARIPTVGALEYAPA
jgi:hypothetical protein